MKNDVMIITEMKNKEPSLIVSKIRLSSGQQITFKEASFKCI